jgi:magnesium transporter
MPEIETSIMDDVLNAGLVEAVRAAVVKADTTRISALMAPLHAADVADLLEQIGATDRGALLALWSGEIDGEILSEIDDAIREEVIESLSPDVLAGAMRALDSDDVVDILEDLDDAQQDAILDALSEVDRVAVEQALAYPEESAGRLMQREVVMAPQDWTVGQAIDFLRAAAHLPDQFYHVILVDPRLQPQGYVTLGRILSARRDHPLRALTEDSFRTIRATDAEADVAYIFNQYHLISCPVVDDAGRLVGVITIDDAMNVLDEQHEEDMLLLAGVGEESHITDGVVETVRQRFPWLFVNLIAVNLSALVIGQFAGTISALVALAALMPVVASMGGNAGTQSLTVAVRALATRDLTRANAMRVVRREVMVGLVNGFAFAAIMAGVGWVGYGSVMLGMVIGLAMVANLLIAALAGVAVPLILTRLRLDPALASGTFVTTLTDMTGFFVFLGLATWILI